MNELVKEVYDLRELVRRQAKQIAELFNLLMEAEPWLDELASSVDSVSLEELMPLMKDIQALKGQDNE